jgi:microsomal dipeptidase-like Zn-dependent dipeptidase
MKDFMIDIHCHPHSKAYSHAFKNPGPPYINHEDHNENNSVWWSEAATSADIQQNVNGLFGLTRFTQSDFRKCMGGRVGIVFASLNQFEKGFTNTRFINGKVTDWAIGQVTEFENARLQFVRRFLDDYFPDVVNEYEFLKSRSGQIKRIGTRTFRYQLIVNNTELEAALKKDEVDEELLIILTIEGAQSLGTGIRIGEATQNINLILNRIDQMKRWDFPPFFITFCHHFYNELCGHARSLGILKLLINQNEGMNKSFTREGIAVRDALLDTSNGKRILIDVKHMNRKSRLSYYQFIKNRNYDIPIIVSHAAITGLNRPGEDSVLGDVKRFYASDGINFYDDELVEIERSQGIFGIQLDERRVGSKRELRRLKGKIGRELLELTSRLVWRQIKHMAEVLDRHGEYAWAIQCIGSDFDGMVNPIDGFFTSEHFKFLDEFLLFHAELYVKDHIKQQMQQKRNWDISAIEIVERIMRENVLHFLENNFN